MKQEKPNMKHIISYSGGLGSAITADFVCKQYGKENVILLFADTLIEDKDLYRFNEDIIKLLGCQFVRIAEGRTPWQVFNDVRYIGNTRVDPCSRVLKRELIRNYLVANYNPEECTIWIGIDCSEEHRLAPVVKRNKPYNYRSYFIENDMFLIPDYKRWWCIENVIKIPRMYDMGFHHNNCGGFCVKAGQGQFEMLWKLLPEVYLKNENEEQLAIKNNPKLRPFLRKTINGKLRYLTLKQFREEFLEQNKNVDSDEFGGCGCAL